MTWHSVLSTDSPSQQTFAAFAFFASLRQKLRAVMPQRPFPLQTAVELEEMFLTRQSEELFPAEDKAIWQGWCEFFSRTREADQRRKGLVEIVL